MLKSKKDLPPTEEHSQRHGRQEPIAIEDEFEDESSEVVRQVF